MRCFLSRAKSTFSAVAWHPRPRFHRWQTNPAQQNASRQAGQTNPLAQPLAPILRHSQITLRLTPHAAGKVDFLEHCFIGNSVVIGSSNYFTAGPKRSTSSFHEVMILAFVFRTL